ncbi:MAG TPA: 4-hydroxy-3-methylbut-2-enyl diphosphate reductase, partial [Solirubrobacteraceae bacterium]|nr:4-hydroxy-3-methylbut-2-enyl diphosphate reductase [Solirubrobacteraceae bacterium]
MSLTVLTPMGIEARAVRGGAPWARVEKFGIGPARAEQAASLLRDDDDTVVIAGFAGALDERLQPGDIVLASELRGVDGAVLACGDPAILAGVLRRAGLRVYVGPIVSSPRLVHGARRRELAATGALAVDMESAWLAEAHGRPVVTLRAVSDSQDQEIYRPIRVASGVRAAYRSLRQAAALLGEWADVLGEREIVLGAPRASCAGVVRAVDIVREALADRGAPIYVRKQIVHNVHVVSELEQLGAVFVEEVDEVPEGATVIYSAHGVSPAVRAAAAERDLDVIDATCPLVAKVHAETRRFARGGYDILLIGHEGHEEVDGTVGEAPDRVRVISSADEVDDIAIADPQRVAYVTQTTLAVDETALVVEALRERFPALAGPSSDDICYATQNRQDAVRALAGDCDIVLVVGSQNSSNSRRLVEVAERAGSRSQLIERADDIRPELLRGVRRVGLTAGASAPEELVEGVVAAIGGLGTVSVSERAVATEQVHFKLPPQVR